MRTAGDAFFVRARRASLRGEEGSFSRLGCGVVPDAMIFSCAACFARAPAVSAAAPVQCHDEGIFSR